MTRWIVVIVIAVLMLCEMLFAVPDLFAQSPARVKCALATMAGDRRCAEGGCS